jgi:translation initiation factor IF-1
VFGKDAIRAEGVIVAVLPQDRFRVELANGHRLLAFPLKRDRVQAGNLVAGDRVQLLVTPFDVSKGCLKFGNS